MKIARKIELLSPARNLETGKAAIDHGADAVYIGAPMFSARAAAGNSIRDIAQLADYAHTFHAKVYIALNTIIKDEELEQVQEMIWNLYRSGADALIVQDMGILEMDLPPIALHASTQTDNRNIEKLRFLEEAGFSQVVLARELSLEQIKEIRQQTSVPLEVFVHGALCTSYSGQCYISQALSQRSANRGECAQYCRLPYSLQDASGKTLITNKHLLSLKDMNRSDQLEALLDAGVTSLKIEGRLKDISYVKNITSFYRQKLDQLFLQRPEYRAASSGKVSHFFIPDPEKSFNRGFTDYFLTGRSKNISSPNTPKSLGEAVGNIKDISHPYFTLQGQKAIHNGDGLCFINQRKELQGFRVNKVEGTKLFPAEMPRLEKGMTIYRNYDHEFEKTLSQQVAERKIAVDLVLQENSFGFTLSATDEDGYSVSYAAAFKKEIAQKPQKENLYTQLSKLGNTPFQLNEFSNRLSANWFIPSSLLSELRRNTILSLLRARKISLAKVRQAVPPTQHPYPEEALTHRANVSNRLAKAFYQRHGAKQIMPAFEQEQPQQVPVMYAKHCIKYQLGFCPKEKEERGKLIEPLTLTTGNHRLRLVFNCRDCEMQVIF